MLTEWLDRCAPGSINRKVLALALRTANLNEFSIAAIRWEAFFQLDEAWSYKQVRDALYRLRERRFPIRHIAHGTYKWEGNQS